MSLAFIADDSLHTKLENLWCIHVEMLSLELKQSSFYYLIAYHAVLFSMM